MHVADPAPVELVVLVVLTQWRQSTNTFRSYLSLGIWFDRHAAYRVGRDPRRETTPLHMAGTIRALA